MPAGQPRAKRRRRRRPSTPALVTAPAVSDTAPALSAAAPAVFTAAMVSAAAPASAPAPVPATTSATFAELGVPAPIVTALAQVGITTPRPVQAATLPDALAGADILGRAQTGSGKTLGFSIPLVARLADGYSMACRPRGLVLVPTRELAAQVHAVLAPLAQAMGLSVATVFGGVPQNPQVAALRNRTDIVVACP